MNECRPGPQATPNVFLATLPFPGVAVVSAVTFINLQIFFYWKQQKIKRKTAFKWQQPAQIDATRAAIGKPVETMDTARRWTG
ncbi:UNVERIFIED_ORG: hypothetical protein J2Y81_000192 [Paraburkholderia sediminicola]|uniref:hypothetical protein n=1 Tax=Paraburkholderia TaxID=1822464 RepID=UPI002111495C|nr:MULTISPECIES: hypothetical protein [Paraburkholderia]MCP2084175.1 hypothetical protein [Paraburkholderia sediminicola]MCX4138890.1 hypothetical protein [Paraburkholderia aspalathi]MDN7171580.1 hypothetical protein [Paraburkholderia sp. SEWSISQ10-3 4]MDQ6501219.1 hypothetical protein [Paraburkholderia aspalathi]